MQRLLLLALIGIGSASANAEEYTVAEKPFHTETKLNAIFLPTKSVAISIKPEVWTDYTITMLASQGAVVKKGDTLIGIETKQIDKQIAEAEKSRASAALTLAAAKHELAQLEITTPQSLEALERGEKQAAEELKWYTEIGHAKQIEETKRSVTSAQLRLDYQKEELKQLLKMYGEDQKTEETEEIILKRTRNFVDQAEFSLKSAKIEADWALGTLIPRKLKAMKRTARDAKLANTSAKEKLPRELKLKQLAVAKAERDDKKSIENLAKLKADRSLMKITAPANGVVYYGSMDHGRWNSAAAVKALKIGGKLPAKTTLMTFVPAGATLELAAFAAEANLSTLATDAKGFAITSLNPYRNIPVSISKLAAYPETDGTYAVMLSPTLNKTEKIVPGMKATIKINAQKIDKALTVPANYLTNQPDGSYTVKLKLADGKSEDRKVAIGASNKDTVVITKGLEKGQVIMK
ncbi:MAG: hypothetical protein AB8F34_06160 [Akkermansiaceae bacterium]